jgi:hypothetical protein
MAGLDGIQGPSDKVDAHNEVLGRHAVLAWFGLVRPVTTARQVHGRRSGRDLLCW